MKRKKNKGITLIALVITIIVLLILAGVSIAMLTGQNGILNQAKQAKERTEAATENEKNDLAKIESQINEYTGNNVVDGVKIPAGFHYAGGNKESGLVISDVQGDDLNNTKQGNQFVWIPVEDYSEFIRREGYSNGLLQTKLDSCGEADATGENEKVTESATTQQEAKDMYKSVSINKGFYIGRYEAGKDANGKTICKKGATVYNNVKWGNSMSDETGGAVKAARNFATEKGYTGVTSTLCYGVQWDAALKFMDPTWDGYVKDSTGKGNYSGSLINTGSNDDYKVKNIYDMAGNVYEWTMESNKTSYRVHRGGDCFYKGFSGPSSSRNNDTTTLSVNSLGFRVTLFI